MATYDTGNIFARILRGEVPAHRVLETDDVLAFMDIMPRAEGHCLVIPKVPARTLLDLPDHAVEPLFLAVRKVAAAARNAMAADGLTIQQFNEPAGGQVVFHLHVHVIPRRDGVPLRPHTGQMADNAVLADHAARIRAALEATA
jgi:histidine triad (HIT) family protein